MMQTTDFAKLHDWAQVRRLDGALVERILIEREVLRVRGLQAIDRRPSDSAAIFLSSTRPTARDRKGVHVLAHSDGTRAIASGGCSS
jgi:hypothetical protein